MDSSDKKTFIVGGIVVLILLPIAIYFGLKLQKSFNEKSAAAAQDSDGGQIGHIGALYDVLDKTDPTRYESTPRTAPGQVDTEALSEAIREAQLAAKQEAAAPAPKKQLPIIPPVWNMDLSTAELPASQVNGSVSGTNFIASTIRLGKNNSTYVLNLRQGTNAIADAEVIVILRLKPTDRVETNKWEIAKDSRMAPQILKKWKTGPRMVAQKTYSSGYTMKLEFGQFGDGVIPGKIYLALPDKEQSVLAGDFEAEAQFAGGRQQISSPLEY